MKKVLIPLLIAALLCVTVSALAAGDKCAFDATVNTVNEGETLQTVLNLEGSPVGGEVTYASSDQSVATVDANGVVTGVKKGKAVITAAVATEQKTYRAQLKLTVARKASSVTVDTSKLPVFSPDDERLAGLLAQRENAEENALQVLMIPVKKSTKLAITVLPKDATNNKVTVTSSDPAILQAKGNAVTGTAPGEAILTVASQTSPEVNTQFRALVVQPVKRLTATAGGSSVAVGAQLPLSVTVEPEDATIRNIAWSSASENIATVTEDGIVTGVKKGNARLVVTALDGSNIRATINVKVTQNAEEIQLNAASATVAAGRNIVAKATVLPKDADDKKVVWASSDESVATVDKNGRISGIALGTCEITCSSVSQPDVKATMQVEVTQPVKAIVFDGGTDVYVGETGQLTWHVEPADASNANVRLSCSSNKVVIVGEDGTLTPVKAGEATVTAEAMDGSNVRARAKVKVLQHVEGVSMRRKVAYIERGGSSTAGAIITPKNASNHSMIWACADPGIATVSGDSEKIKITGVSYGDTVITGTTVDGGFQASIQVKVGDWEKSLSIREAHVEGDQQHITVANDSDLTITSITVKVAVTDIDGNPVPCCTKDGGNVFTMTYSKTLEPGAVTRDRDWKFVDYKLPESSLVSQYEVRITEFQIDNDWVKVIRKNHQPSKKCPVHL